MMILSVAKSYWTNKYLSFIIMVYVGVCVCVCLWGVCVCVCTCVCVCLCDSKRGCVKAGILRDKTMDDKLIYVHPQ